MILQSLVLTHCQHVMGQTDTLPVAKFHPNIVVHGTNNSFSTVVYFVVCYVLIYNVAHKKRPQFSALEKTHFVSLGRIALTTGSSTVCTLLTCHMPVSRTVTLICCLNVVNFIRAMSSSSCTTVLRHTFKSDATISVSRTLQTS